MPLAAQLIGQPVDRTTLVNLDRVGDDTGVTVWALADRPADVAPLPTLESWAAVRARMDLLAQARAALLPPALRETLEAERGALIDGANAKRLDDAGWARLAALNGVFEAGTGLPELDALLDQVQVQWLDRYDYVEDLELVGPSYRDLRRYDVNPSPKPVGTLRPVERAFTHLTGRVVADVDRATALLASLAARIDALQHPTAERLVRVLPATPDTHSQQWARRVAVGWLEGASRRAQARLYVRTADGWTASTPELLRDTSLDQFALHITGAMLDRLVDPELGFHLWIDHVGADLVCSLARVEALPGEGDPVARLTAADAAFATWRAARLRGDAAPTPRPALPIARRYGGEARPGQLVAAADARALQAFWAQEGVGA